MTDIETTTTETPAAETAETGVRISQETLQLIGEVLGGIAAVAGQGQYAGLIASGVQLAGKLSLDTGYEIPSADALRDKAREVAAMEDLVAWDGE